MGGIGQNADITASNLIYGVNEMYNWVEEEYGDNTLSTEGALILTGDCGRAIGTFEYMFHRIGRHNPELKRRMAINETLPQMSWTTGVAKAKATNVAKANTKSRDSILSGGLPPLSW
ncbi:hypothetical protein BGZ80_000544 [Entomortierella chlamydospora]|uniref:Uncharacterized protein n=1 Tax=Entomortierella chlamydospora TaxID=101097 RepID=A0A9P6SYE4_9FUNG|nr:hypothetical protein BGZ80_000544 [Entomortierella chlamydospora]